MIDELCCNKTSTASSVKPLFKGNLPQDSLATASFDSLSASDLSSKALETLTDTMNPHENTWNQLPFSKLVMVYQPTASLCPALASCGVLVD